jgi:hypothetical protein
VHLVEGGEGLDFRAQPVNGNSSKGPNDGGAKCHPPGQTETEPGCK